MAEIRTDALDRFRALFRRPPEEIRNRLSDWFYSYHRDVFELGVSIEFYIRKVEAMVRELKGCRRVVDLGAGFGVYAALMRILGIEEVIVLDYHENKLPVVRKLWRELELGPPPVIRGDGTALGLGGNSVDGAVLLACISHIREPDLAISECARIIRPGGRIYIFEDNNSTYPLYHRGMQPVWDAADTGKVPDGMHSVRVPKKPYAETRKEIIAKGFPELRGAGLEEATRLTRGLFGRGLAAGVREFIEKGSVTNPHVRIARCPESGEFHENPVNPSIIMKMLRNSGFKPCLRNVITGPWSGWRGRVKWGLAGLFRACPCLLHRGWPIYAVTGEKKAQGSRP